MGCAATKGQVCEPERKLSDTTASTSAPLGDALAELLGPKLLTKKGVVPTQQVGGKTIGLYFSAHWCPPCRGFTPQLAQAYSKHLKAKGLEIVFVSSDRSEADFNSYFKDMPWAALPFEDRDRKAALSKKFKVQGIPTLVLLDSEGSVITTDARSQVSQDPTGQDFPWAPKPVEELLGSTFLGKAGKVQDALEGKVVGLYFSAHWCPPCKMFTPQLAEQYKKIQAAGLPFEIVFVSSDRSENDFKQYFAEMPWLALPYEKRKEKEALSSRFGVQGIPTLVLLDKDRSVLTTNGRGAVFQDLSEFPWPPAPVKDLKADFGGINEATSVVVLADGADAAAQQAAKAAMQPLGAEYMAQAKAAGEDPELLFYLATSGEGPVGRVRELCGLEAGKKPQLVLLDIPDNGGFYLPQSELTTEALRKMIADFRAGKLTRKQFR